MTSVTFTVPVRPIGTNHGYALSAWGGHARMRMTDAGRAFKEAVYLSARKAMRGRAMLDGALEVRLLLVYPDNRSDLDSGMKFTVDSLQGAVFKNDRAVRRLVAEKAADPKRPRVEITVTEITP